MAYQFPDSPAVFFEDSVPTNSREEIRAFIEKLPPNSVVGQWAIGISPTVPAGAVGTELDVYKDWHGSPGNPHFTMRLAWVDEHRNTIKTCAKAHVYKDGHESVQEFTTAVRWYRQPGSTTWVREDPVARRGPQVQTILELPEALTDGQSHLPPGLFPHQSQRLPQQAERRGYYDADKVEEDTPELDY